jgi:hypothetical protein
MFILRHVPGSTERNTVIRTGDSDLFKHTVLPCFPLYLHVKQFSFVIGDLSLTAAIYSRDQRLFR